jgi:single-stranded-DNA-specific exonuclease
LDEKKEYKLIVRSGKHWPQGIVGVVAGRICDEFNCPVFLLKENKDIFEGSGRSIENFNIVEAVSKIDKYVEKYGGHAQAMGIKIKPKNVQVFERELLKLIERDFDEEKWGKKLLIDAEIEPTMIDWDLLAEIKRFEPFGEGNREPVFMSKNLRLLDIKVVGNGQKHLKFIFQIGGAKMVEGIFWKSGERFSEFQAGDMLTVVYNLRSNEWNGSRKLELHIIDVKK